MNIKHKTILILLIIIIVMDIGFLVTIIANVYATYSISQIYFQFLSYCDLVFSLIWLGDITDFKKNDITL